MHAPAVGMQLQHLCQQELVCVDAIVLMDGTSEQLQALLDACLAITST